MNRIQMRSIIYHIVVILFVFIMIYPVLWLLSSSFKENTSIFSTSNSFIPRPFILTNYSDGWRGIGGIPFVTFIKNSLVLVVIATFGAVLSSAVIAFGFSRIKFFGKNFWFSCMMLTLMLPHDVVMVPQYVIFNKLHWLNTILPIVVPPYFGVAFFIFLMMQFIRTIPVDMDEAAKIDGCSRFGIFTRIVLPLILPAMATAAIFSFYQRWDDFLGPLLYLNSPSAYPVSMALKLFLDSETVSNWGAMFAMSIVSLLPVIAVFFAFQKQIVEGISTSGLKG
ncbi:MAG: carbohydrate ABC transporter permease [Gorillibacterium sp.]|nr:carbohydrate ABC transporter permease [Gorillibacterium sp.]